MKRILTLILTLCMLLALCACGSQSTETSPAPAKELSGETPAVETGNTTDSGIKRGNTMVLRRAGITPINPLKTIAPQGDAVVYGLAFECLTWWDENDFSAKPWLATDWEFSENGLQLTMHLDEKAVFSDGNPVNAEAVKATFEFYLSEEAGHIQKDLISNLSSVEAVSEHEVCFNFSAPDSGFLTTLTQPIGYILNPIAIEKYKESDDPEIFAREGGSGPFVLKSMIDGESYTFTRNPNYYKIGEDGQPLPYLDGAVVMVVGDTAVACANLQSGDIDVIDRVQSISDIENLRADSNITMIDLAFAMTHFLYMNTTKAPFDDIRVREAMCYAVDRQDLINTLVGGDGIITPNIVLPNQSWYNDEVIQAYTYDPDKSRELLAEAGYEDGVTVELYYGTYSNMQQISELVQSQAAAAGFNIELVGVDGAMNKEIWASYNEETPAGMRLNDISLPKTSPYVQLEYIFGPTALQNCSKWFDPQVASYLDQIRAETNDAKRDQLCVDFQALQAEFIPIVEMHTVSGVGAVRSWCEGINYSGEGVPYITEAWLNK